MLFCPSTHEPLTCVPHFSGSSSSQTTLLLDTQMYISLHTATIQSLHTPFSLYNQNPHICIIPHTPVSASHSSYLFLQPSVSPTQLHVYTQTTLIPSPHLLSLHVHKETHTNTSLTPQPYSILYTYTHVYFHPIKPISLFTHTHSTNLSHPYHPHTPTHHTHTHTHIPAHTNTLSLALQPLSLPLPTISLYTGTHLTLQDIPTHTPQSAYTQSLPTCSETHRAWSL